MEKNFNSCILGNDDDDGQCLCTGFLPACTQCYGQIGVQRYGILIDPMLAEKGRYEGFAGSFNSEVRNPKVDLPESKEDVLKDVDALIVHAYPS